jgi:ribonucleoside-diphosphate reductase alpha chain
MSVTIASIPEDIKKLYRTVWEIPMKSLVDMAADRGAYIDQSQSLNLFMEAPTIGKLSSMYMYGWKKGLKTTYYLRSRPATSIQKTTVTKKSASGSATPVATEVEAAPAVTTAKKEYSDAEVIACSIDNPEACEACQ